MQKTLSIVFDSRHVQDMAAGPVHQGDETWLKTPFAGRDIGGGQHTTPVNPIDHQVAQQVGIHPVLRVGHAGARACGWLCLHRHQAHQRRTRCRW